jgi:hypothetical protein
MKHLYTAAILLTVYVVGARMPALAKKLKLA